MTAPSDRSRLAASDPSVRAEGAPQATAGRPLVTGTSPLTMARSMAAASMRSAVVPLISLATLPIILGHLSVSEYGLWVTLAGLIAILATIDAGLSTMVTRRAAVANGAGDISGVIHAGREGISTSLRLSLITVPVVGLLGVPVVSFVAPPEDFRLGMLLWLALLVLRPIAGYYMMLAGVIVGLQRSELSATATTVGGLAGALVTVLAVAGGLGVWGMVAGGLAGSITAAVGFMYFARRLTGSAMVWIPVRSPGWGRAAATGLALASLEASLIVEPAASKLVLSVFDGTDSAAAYQLGSSVTRVGLIAAIAPTSALLVGIAEWRVKSPDRVATLIRHATSVSLGVVSVMTIVLVSLGPYLADAWLGISVPGVGTAIRGLSLVAVATQVVWLLSKVLLGFGHTRAVTACLIIGSVVALVLMVPGGAAMGMPGVIGASLIGALAAAWRLGRLDTDVSAVVWRAARRMLPLPLGLSLVGALTVDAYHPSGRIPVLLLAAAVALVSACLAWFLLPRDCRALVGRTIRSRLSTTATSSSL